MTRVIVLYIICLLANVCMSQNISVISFRVLDTDLTANTAGTIEMDQNGETAALIKVVTIHTGFYFDGGALGIVKTVQKPSEIWVYVPRGLKKITISHPQFGLLRDYYLKIPIEAARTYEMCLDAGGVQTLKSKDELEYKNTREAANPIQRIDSLKTNYNTQRRTITVNHKSLGPVSFDMICVEGGSFLMGDRYCTVPVTLSSFYIGETEVTQELWEAVMGKNPSKFKGYKRPVEQVSWNDCKKFIVKLNALTGLCFRLPTEAEWEFAALGGNKSQGYLYSGSYSINDVLWCDENSGGQTHNVKMKGSNELGLYDMSGNVEEWIEDYWQLYYTTSDQTNPKGPSNGKTHVIRGGSWDLQDSRCYVRGSRGYDTPHYKYKDLGLRLAQ